MMAGHKRRDGYPVCPDTPPATRPNSCSPSGCSHSPDSEMFEDLEIPQYGTWHRRNPNWVDRSPVRRPHSPPYAGSLVSTVINSDACSVAKLEDEEDATTENNEDDDDERDNRNRDRDHRDRDRGFRDRGGGGGGGGGGGPGGGGGGTPPPGRSIGSFDSSLTRSSSSFIGHVFKSSVPLASLFAMPRQDIPHVQKAANKQGLHVGLVRNPRSSTQYSAEPSTSSLPSPTPSLPSKPHHHHHKLARATAAADWNNTSPTRGIGTPMNDGICRESSWWVVMGRSADAVRHLVDLQQRGMPGVFATDRDLLVEEKPPASHTMWFCQLVLAGVFGGLAVVYGLSLL